MVEVEHGSSRLVAVSRRGKRTGETKRCMGVSRYRMPVSAVFENLEAGATIEEIANWFGISKEQIIEVLAFAPAALLPRFR